MTDFKTQVLATLDAEIAKVDNIIALTAYRNFRATVAGMPGEAGLTKEAVCRIVTDPLLVPDASVSARLTNALAALPSAPEPQTSKQRPLFYMVEWPRNTRDGGETGWWCGREHGADRFTWDVTKAIHFPTKAAAEAIAAVANVSPFARVTEHMWMEGPAPTGDALERALDRLVREAITYGRDQSAHLGYVETAKAEILRLAAPWRLSESERTLKILGEHKINERRYDHFSQFYCACGLELGTSIPETHNAHLAALIHGSDVPPTKEGTSELFDLESVLDPTFCGGLSPVEYLNRLHDGSLGERDANGNFERQNPVTE